MDNAWVADRTHSRLLTTGLKDFSISKIIPLLKQKTPKGAGVYGSVSTKLKDHGEAPAP